MRKKKRKTREIVQTYIKATIYCRLGEKTDTTALVRSKSSSENVNRQIVRARKRLKKKRKIRQLYIKSIIYRGLGKNTDTAALVRSNK